VSARYAIYYAPAPGSSLWSFGSAVLGYDAATGEPRQPLAPPGVDTEEWRAITAQPRRYGFHATLKAPFHLAEGRSEDDLVAAGREFARTQRPFELPSLEIASIEGFVALSPVEPCAELDTLAGACVRAFEPFRAAPSPQEMARRLLAPLTERQRAALKAWGYPYVFEDFHFHMTLTGSLADAEIPPVAEGLRRLYADHVGAARTPVDAVTLYVEERPENGFHIVDRFVFAA
jgi:putative phosphonate metabolism protein